MVLAVQGMKNGSHQNTSRDSALPCTSKLICQPHLSGPTRGHDSSRENRTEDPLFIGKASHSHCDGELFAFGIETDHGPSADAHPHESIHSDASIPHGAIDAIVIEPHLVKHVQDNIIASQLAQFMHLIYRYQTISKEIR